MFTKDDGWITAVDAWFLEIEAVLSMCAFIKKTRFSKGGLIWGYIQKREREKRGCSGLLILFYSGAEGRVTQSITCQATYQERHTGNALPVAIYYFIFSKNSVMLLNSNMVNRKNYTIGDYKKHQTTRLFCSERKTIRVVVLYEGSLALWWCQLRICVIDSIMKAAFMVQIHTTSILLYKSRSWQRLRVLKGICRPDAIQTTT